MTLPQGHLELLCPSVNNEQRGGGMYKAVYRVLLVTAASTNLARKSAKITHNKENVKHASLLGIPVFHVSPRASCLPNFIWVALIWLPVLLKLMQDFSSFVLNNLHCYPPALLSREF